MPTAPWWTNRPERDLEKNVPNYLIADSEGYGCLISRIKKKNGCLHVFYRTTATASWPDGGSPDTLTDKNHQDQL